MTTTNVDRSPDGRRARRIERMTQDCRHYAGIGCGQTTCHAGVAYLDVTAYDATQHRNVLPCLFSFAGERLGQCPKFATLTPAEAATQMDAEDTAIAASIERIGKARTAIVAATGNAGGAGQLPCPNCDGTLSYSQARSNKHVHARCSTTGCVAWME